MRGKRIAVWLVALATLAVLGCAGAIVLYQRYVDTSQQEDSPGLTKPLTLTQVEAQTRLDLPAGSHVIYGEQHIDGDWAVAAQISFDRSAMAQFVSGNGLPPAIDGLRPVPALGPVTTGPPAAESADPTASAGTTPTGAAAPTGAAIPTVAAPTGSPDPAHVPPALFGPLVRDAPDWHPERATTVAGIGRTVKGAVARWLMFDLDDPQVVMLYLYAMPEVPTASRTPTASPSATAR